MRKRSLIHSIVLSAVLSIYIGLLAALPASAAGSQSSLHSYGADTYKTGSELPVGEYVLFAEPGYTGYFCLSEDSRGDSIISNGLFRTFTIFRIAAPGKYFEISRACAVPFDEVTSLDTSSEGMWKVGVHIPAGEYKLKADSGAHGYYCVYADSDQEDIITNDLFENSTYITVTDGQYFSIERCSIISRPDGGSLSGSASFSYEPAGGSSSSGSSAGNGYSPSSFSSALETTLAAFPDDPFTIFHQNNVLYEGGIIAGGSYTGVMYLLGNSSALYNLEILEDNNSSFNTVCIVYASDTALNYILGASTAVVTLLDPSISSDDFSELFLECVEGGSYKTDRLEAEYHEVNDTTYMILFRSLQ